MPERDAWEGWGLRAVRCGSGRGSRRDCGTEESNRSEPNRRAARADLRPFLSARAHPVAHIPSPHPPSHPAPLSVFHSCWASSTFTFPSA
jgi:hypothetical protein